MAAELFQEPFLVAAGKQEDLRPTFASASQPGTTARENGKDRGTSGELPPARLLFPGAPIRRRVYYGYEAIRHVDGRCVIEPLQQGLEGGAEQARAEETLSQMS